ncbi:subtilisin-like protease [Phyllosticta citribraziliensis]|uniref:Subtilisin-like protease n=1 Tax=Phyllosticta citribraziliensis TaxID=989973 RepID=A0ABR1M544_9PEZI
MKTSAASIALFSLSFGTAVATPLFGLPDPPFFTNRPGFPKFSSKNVSPQASTPQAVGTPVATPASTPVVTPLANLSNVSTHQSGGEQYIVLFNASHPTTPEIEEVLQRLELNSSHSDVHHIYNNSAFRGFSASMKSHCIDALNGMVDVSHVERSVSIKSLAVTQRSGAPWGLERISSGSTISGDEKATNFTYTYEYTALGSGVDIYVVDTGVNVDHIVFDSRARNGWTAFPSGGPVNGGWTNASGDYTDGAGHGTHVSGTSAGEVFGVASGANIIAVRVLDANGGGSSNNTIAGIDWVVQQHEKRKTEPDFVGSILSMSFGTDEVVTTLSEAIRAATAAGIHASVASGNKGADACNFSPSNVGGSAGDAVVVGSIGMSDSISSFSNTGKCVDIYAPGENILSSYIGSENTIQYLSGTSMACPHVTGVMAYLMAHNATLGQSPQAMKELLKTTALSDLVSGTASTAAGSTVLLNNGVTNALQKRGNSASQAKDAGLNFSLSEEETKTWW